MDDKGLTRIEKESSNTMEDLFCGSSFDDDVDVLESSFLDSNGNITGSLEDNSAKNMQDNSFSLVLEESSSDEMSNIDSENSCIKKIIINNYPHSFDQTNVDMNPFSKNGESLCEVNTCCEVAENMIKPQMSVSGNNHSCISQTMSLNCDNPQVVISCVKSPIPKITNTYKEICKNEDVKIVSSSQANPIAGSEKMSFPTTAAVEKMKLDNTTERTLFPVASQFEQTVDTLVKTNGTCGTAVIVTPLDMMEHVRMSEMSFDPCDESDLIDLDLEFVPFGLPSPGEYIMSQERSPILRHETQASFLEYHKQKCAAAKRMESSTRLSFDNEQGTSSQLTSRMNQKLQDSESVEDQKCRKVGCIKFDDHPFAKCREDPCCNQSSCHEDIPSREYCLIDHNLTFFAHGSKIKLQFDVNENVFTCPFCSVTPLNRETIGQHILNHTSDKELKCLLGCSDVFATMKEVVDHLNSHKDNGVYRCGACQNPFPSVALIKSHVALLHEPHQLNKHTHDHTVDKKFMCSKCDLTFIQEVSLNAHNLKECSSQSHSCSLCERLFLSASELTKHATSHCTQRPYHCKLCSYASDNRSYLNFHLNQHRNYDLPYTCPECCVVCPNEASYMAHVLELHCSGNLSCVCCKRSDFTHGHQLMVHMRTHEAHGWTENKVPGLRLMLSLQVMSAVRREEDIDDDDNTITVTDCDGVRLQFTPDNYLSSEEQDLVSFEMNIT